MQYYLTRLKEYKNLNLNQKLTPHTRHRGTYTSFAVGIFPEDFIGFSFSFVVMMKKILVKEGYDPPV